MKLENELDKIARRGTEAWKRVKKSRDFADYLLIGEALLAMREEAMNAAGIPLGSNHPPVGSTYNSTMGALLQQYKMDDIDKGDRSRLFSIMEHRAEIEAWHRSLPLSQRLKLNNPSTIWRHWSKLNAPPKQKDDRKPSTLQKTEGALKAAYQEIDQLKTHVEELEAARETSDSHTETASGNQLREMWQAELLAMPYQDRVNAILYLLNEIEMHPDDLFGHPEPSPPKQRKQRSDKGRPRKAKAAEPVTAEPDADIYADLPPVQLPDAEQLEAESKRIQELIDRP